MSDVSQPHFGMTDSEADEQHYPPKDNPFL